LTKDNEKKRHFLFERGKKVLTRNCRVLKDHPRRLLLGGRKKGKGKKSNTEEKKYKAIFYFDFKK
jgi:hypothetical protein